MEVLGIGTDITECLRIAQMIEHHGEQFVSRVYTPEETCYCRNRKQATQHFTGRWAAKEAVLKALGTGWRRGISWHDVEVCNQPGGRPVIVLRGGAREVARQLGIQRVQISISHCRSYAVAFAVALGNARKAKRTAQGGTDGAE
jgi:holo-[acyl-carrier protein] synthase